MWVVYSLSTNRRVKTSHGETCGFLGSRMKLFAVQRCSEEFRFKSLLSKVHQQGAGLKVEQQGQESAST